MRHDDGHPLRPIRIPPPSPRQRDAARLATATAGAVTAGNDPDPHDPAAVWEPSGAGWSGVAAEPRDGRPRFLVPRTRDDASEEPVRVQAMRAPAWVELRESAWLITRESGSIVHASDLVYDVLGRTPDELAALLGDPGEASPGYSWIRRTVIAHGHAGVVLRILQADGSVRQVEVVSRRLPRRTGAEDRYFSVLTLREG